MATVDLSHVQFWQPPLNRASFKQHTAAPQIRKNGGCGLTASSRTPPVSPPYRADKLRLCSAHFEPAITAARSQRRDSTFQHEDNAAGAQGTMKENSWMSLANLLCASQAAITILPTATVKQVTQQATISPLSTSSWHFRARRPRRDTRILRILRSISKHVFPTQAEAISIRTSPNQMIVLGIAKALEVCASALITVHR